MSELRLKCWNCGSTPQPEQYNHFDGHWSLLIWFHYYFLSEPQFWHLNRNSDIWPRLSKMATFDAQKKQIWGPKKRHSPNPCWHGLFAKNRVQIGQIWLLWPHLYFTPAYRGSPLCTLFQHPDNREIGYSNVLPWRVSHGGCPREGVPGREGVLGRVSQGVEGVPGKVSQLMILATTDPLITHPLLSLIDQNWPNLTFSTIFYTIQTEFRTVVQGLVWANNKESCLNPYHCHRNHD